jgi:hypothetical protein
MSTNRNINNTSPIPPVPFAEPIVSNDDYGIKPASPDIILIPNDSLPVELMTELIFENIGGREIINVARHDLINGQPVVYSPIKQLPTLEYQLDPNTIIGLQKTAPENFLNFPVKFEAFLPGYVGTLEQTNVYYDPVSKGLVVEVTNINNNERVELQIASTINVLDDTIYTDFIQLSTEES